MNICNRRRDTRGEMVWAGGWLLLALCPFPLGASSLKGWGAAGAPLEQLRVGTSVCWTPTRRKRKRATHAARERKCRSMWLETWEVSHRRIFIQKLNIIFIHIL